MHFASQRRIKAIKMSKTLILIPSRMSAERLPGKPLLEVNGLPIICHVVKKAQETQIGEVVVATEDEEILNTVKKNHGEAILTSKNPQTGTDRIWEAFQKLNLKNIRLKRQKINKILPYKNI